MATRSGPLARYRSALVVGAGVALLALLGAFAYLLLDSQSRVQKESEKRFKTRAVVSAALTESLFGSAAGQQQQAAAKAFGGRHPQTGVLVSLVKRSHYQYGLILGSKGQVLAASAGTPRDVRRRSTPPGHILEGLKGRPYLSGLLHASRGAGVIEWALPFDTPFGRRVEVVGMSSVQLRDFVGSYLARGRESSQMDADLIDGAKRVIADAASDHETTGLLDPQLAGALSSRQGTYREGGTERYFTSAPVGGSDWRIVVSEPTSTLYPLLATGRRWVLWGMFAAFALAALASLVLSRRVLRSTAQLRSANAQLTKRQRALGLANERLEGQTRLAHQASRAKSDFLANMSHELRTPLNSIIGFSELMMSGAGETEAERKEYLGHIITGGRHLEQLINDILDLSKVEAGKMQFHPEPADLVQLIDDLVGTMRVLAEKKQIQLAVDVDPEVRSAVVDRARLKQVLYNYLSNAIKFTPEQGRVTVRAQPEDDESFRLAVADTGVGISAHDQQTLFREFQQLDQTAQKQHQGTGLGLALVKRLVEAQGGNVGVHSEPGRGSTFYAVLPRHSQPAQGVTNGKPAPLVHLENGVRVLVVEDDRHDQEVIERLLSSSGYVVELASTGADAIARSRDRHFDAVVLDLILPDLGGFEVLRKIRDTGKNPNVPTIVVTMVAEEGLGKAFAVTDWLVKPVDPDDLLTSLDRALGSNEDGTVLVVDDDPASLQLAQATIEQLGCQVVCAPGGEEGLEAAAKNRPLAAIVLDLLMPGVDGFQFLERLRQDGDGEQVPVIVWTSKDLTAAELATLRISTQGLVGKSQQEASLVDELRRCLVGGNGSPPGVRVTNGR